MNQRHVDLGALPPPLAPIVAHQRPADAIAFGYELPMKPHRRDALLGGGAEFPLRHQLLEPRLYRFPHRPLAPTPKTPHRLGLIQILGYRVAA
jgi:hypothetical protein